MKKILIGLFAFIMTYSSFGQSPGNDTSKYIYYRYTYGNAMDRYWAKYVLMLPDDTTYSKNGVALRNGVLYTGNGVKWSLVTGSGSGGGIDSIRRKVGSDSVFWYTGGTKVFAFRDSVGTGGVGSGGSADSLKKLPVDTSASPRNGYVLAFDSVLHKWKLVPPGSLGGYDSSIMQTKYRSDTARNNVYNTITQKDSGIASGNFTTRSIVGKTIIIDVDTSKLPQVTNIIRATGGSGLLPFTTYQSGYTFIDNRPRYRDTSAAATQYAADSALTIATHDTTSANALASKYGVDSAKIAIRNSLASKITDPTTSAGQLIYRNSSGSIVATAAPAHAGMRPVWDGSVVKYTDTTAGGGGGSQDLKSVTTLGDSTNKRLVTSDSSKSQNFYSHGNLYLGDSIIGSNYTVYFHGDSWTAGQASTTHALSFAALVAKYMGYKENNQGHIGWTMGSQGLGSSFYELVTAGGAIPTWQPGMKAIIAYGVNDAVFSIDTTTVFKPQYGVVLDSFTNRGWTNKDLVLVTTGYTPTSSVGTRLPNYVSATKSVAAAKGFKVFDMYNWMLTHGGNSLLKWNDLLHPNDTGHAVYAQGIMSAFLPNIQPGGGVDAKASVTAGLDVTAGRDLTIGGASTFTGDESHAGYQKANAANGYFARFQNAHLSSSGQYGEMRFVFLNSDNYPDSSWIRNYTNGGHSELALGYMSSTRIRFPYNAGVNINSATGDGTNTNYINGSTGINGAVTVTGNTTVTGQLFSTGGTSINPQQLLLFTSGNVKYGMGVQAGGDFPIFSGNGNVVLGNMSTSDGSTFTGRFSVGRTGTTSLASGNVMVIGGASDNGKGILQVLGKSYLGNSSTDTIAAFARASYSTNLGSTFTRYSLVDKNYADSMAAAKVAAAGSGAPFSTSTAIMKDQTDATKLLNFNLSGFTTATTRTWTFPNASGTVARIDAGQTFTGVQTFSSSPIVPTASAGDNSTNAASTAYADVSSAAAVASIVKYAATADGSTISNTTTPGTLIGSGIGSVTFPANFFTAGRTFEIEGQALISTAASNPDISYTLSVGLSGFAFATYSQASLSSIPVVYKLIGTCRSTGSSGIISVYGSIRSNGVIQDIVRNDLTVNTTGTISIDLKASFNTASSSNTIKGQMFTIKSY